MTAVEGFVLDCYSDPARREMVTWIMTGRGAASVRESFTPVLYARGPDAASLDDLARALALLPQVGETSLDERKCGLEDKKSLVLRVPVREHHAVLDVAQAIDARGGFRDYEVFDADLRMSQRYMLAKGIWPLAEVRADGRGGFEALEKDGKWGIHYRTPPFVKAELDVRTRAPAGSVPTLETPLASARLRPDGGEAVVLEGAEDEILRGIHEETARLDPDIVLTSGGDSFLLPYLHARARAAGVAPFHLGREPDPGRPRRRGKSYFSYGKIKYQAPHVALHGRVHLDRETSFFHSEAGLAGLVDIARISRVPLQDVARLGAGTALTAVQIDLAAEDGRLVPWKKNVPEAFKSARDLRLSDRGAFIFDAAVGLHEDVHELDFSSMFPNIMVRHNVSPETFECACCDPRTLPPERVTPEVGSWTCGRRAGFIPRYIGPIIDRRERFKQIAREDPARRAEATEIQYAYKWVNVTSFGYMGYRNAKFGRIECHETINAWGREIILRTAETARDLGFEVLHGIVDSLWLRRVVPGAEPSKLVEAVKRGTGLRFDHEGRFKWIVFLPTRGWAAGADAPPVAAFNRYYGCFDRPPSKPSRSQAGQPLDYLAGGAMKVRGIELRQRSAPRVVREAQERFLEVVARADDAAGVRGLLPRALDAAGATLRRVREGACALEDLVIANSVAKAADEYAVTTCASAALRQLAREGVRVEPGESVRYVITDLGSRDAARKVREARLLRGDEAYDREAYARLVLRAIASLVLPLGYPDEDAVARHYGRTRQTRLA